MPHVQIHHFPKALDDRQHAALAQEVTAAVCAAFGVEGRAVSIALVAVEPSDWTDGVYHPLIINTPGTLIQRPGY